MRLTGPDLNMRQPRGVRNPQSNDSARTRHTGPTPKRSLNSSMYATFNAVPGRASPRKKADAVVNISFARLNRPTTLVIIQQRASAPDSADQFRCLAMSTHSFTVCTM